MRESREPAERSSGHTAAGAPVFANRDAVNHSCYRNGETEKNLKMLARREQDREVSHPKRGTENKMLRYMADFLANLRGAPDNRKYP